MPIETNINALGITSFADLRDGLHADRLADALRNAPSPPVAPQSQGFADVVPQALVDAGAESLAGHEWKPIADRFTSSRFGRAALGKRYRSSTDGTDWARLELDLRTALRARGNVNGGPALDSAAAAVVDRVRDVRRYLLAPERLRSKSFGPITAGENPWRPVNVPTSPWEQRDVTVLARGQRTLQIRYVDLAPPARADGIVVLLHGHGSRLEEYTKLAAMLRDRYRVIVLDIPSNGYSEMTLPQRYDMTLYMQLVNLFLDAIAPGLEVFVAGGSLGANLAIRLGAWFPKRFKKIAAWAPGSSWKPGNPGVQAAIAGLDILRDGGAFIGVPMWDRFKAAYDIQKGYWGISAAELADDAKYREEMRSDGYARAYFDIAKEELQSSLHVDLKSHPVEVPAYVAIGEKDSTPGLNDGASALAHDPKLMPRASFETFSCGHSIAGLQTDELVASLERFFGAG